MSTSACNFDSYGWLPMKGCVSLAVWGDYDATQLLTSFREMRSRKRNVRVAYLLNSLSVSMQGTGSVRGTYWYQRSKHARYSRDSGWTGELFHIR